MKMHTENMTVQKEKQASHKYDYQLDLSDPNRSHTKILKWIAPLSVVLEIGCATGYLTRYLKTELNCRVVGLEIDAAAAAVAEPYCEKMIIGDVEDLPLEELLGEYRFHVVLLADVLEHLKNPAALLNKMRGLLLPEGYVLMSVPNGAHGSLALELLDGKWEYRREGLLDETHLRFFDKDRLAGLLDDCGYFISRLERVIIHPRDTEMKTPWDSYPREVTAYLEKVNPEYQTYQFVLKAFPLSEPGWKRGLMDALDAETVKALGLEKQLSGVYNDLAYYKGEYDAFQTELDKRKEEYLREIAALDEKWKREIQQVHSGYEAALERLEAEKKHIHEGYRAELARRDQMERGKERERNDLQLERDYIRRELQKARDGLQALENEKNGIQGLYQREVAELRSSVFFRLLMFYRRWIERLLPNGTRRRRFYRLCVLAPVVLFTEGPASFFRKIGGRLPLHSKRVEQGTVTDAGSFQPLIFPVFDRITCSVVIPVFNQCHHTYQCLCSILAHTDFAYEVVVVDNASSDATPRMLGAMEGLKVIRNAENQGFVDACNRGAQEAAGEYLLFLNNDTEVTPGWLNAMLAPFEDQRTGIVGARLIYPDGRLQEAGNIIFKDGTGWNYGRGDDPNLPQYSYRKEVDYCSGACLMIPRSLWAEIGGFDRRYAPAYYEDTDLCFTVRKMGYRVIYQPEARVIHHEGLSAGRDLTKGYKRYQQVNLAKFREKWREVLAADHYQGSEDVYLARERGFQQRAIIVDHYAPTFDMDSGSLRMFNLIKIITELGYKVVFWPENRAYHERYTVELQRLGVEAIYGAMDFEEYLGKWGRHFHLVLLSRPHVAMQFIYAARRFTNARIIYDTVDLHFLREERRARCEAEASAQEWKNQELFLANLVDDTLTVSPVEKEILEKEKVTSRVAVISNIHALEECRKGYDQRRDLMFIGGFEHLPNEDGIVWFVRSILPRIHQILPEVRLTVVGSRPGPKVRDLACEQVQVTGYVPDVSSYFENARVFVSPLRYGAGVKGKIGQSLSYGLPVVTTSVGAEGMGLVHGSQVLIADEEKAFAEQVIRLYQDRGLWDVLSANGRKHIEAHYSPECMKQKLREVLMVNNQLLTNNC